ncbi:hypothetical protein EVAR_88317_1 [Eumeta japonica]|uniref:Uncharacterized protein n=1 Tax=Eumeta variegata TaxID=151549 RepID=A0A4C1VPX3_EUMVA|nr:hypothetical protein EVAR_88317_1 [Eumeta japonica]
MKSSWRFINGGKGHVLRPNTMTYDDGRSHNDHHVCELFSDHFGSAYDKDTVDGLDNYLDSNTTSDEALASVSQLSLRQGEQRCYVYHDPYYLINRYRLEPFLHIGRQCILSPLTNLARNLNA